MKLLYKQGEFAGKPFIEIVEVRVDRKTNQETEVSLLKFGIKKAKALLQSSQALEDFIKEHTVEKR